MKIISLILAIAGLMIAAPAHAAEEFPRQYTAVWTATPPVIDGSLRDACWTKAGVATRFTVTATGTAPEAQTRVRALVDDTHLYVAYNCLEPRMDRIRAEPRERDSAIWADDTVEFIIDPDNLKNRLFHIIISAAGAIYDASAELERSGHTQEDSKWNCDLKVAVGKGRDGWNVEASIPLADLGIAREHSPYAGVNFARGRVGARAELSSWSPTNGLFASPAHLGEMRIAWKDRPAAVVSLAKQEVFAVGDNKATISLRHISGSEEGFFIGGDAPHIRAVIDVEYQVAGASLHRGELTATLGATAGPRQWALPFRPEGPGPHRLTVTARDASSGKLLYRGARTFDVVAQLELREQLYELFQHRADAELRLTLPSYARRDASASVVVTLHAEGDDKPLASRTLTNLVPGSVRVSFDLKGKPAGRYTIKASLSGEGPARTAVSRPFPYHPGPEVRLDAKGRLIVNGKARFPVGVYTLQSKEGKHDEVLAEARAAGFNTTVYYAYARDGILKLLDAAARNGIGAFVYATDPVAYREGRLPRETLLADIAARADHPALLGWYLVDEPEGIGKAGFELVRELYQTLKETDKDHPSALVIMSPAAAKAYEATTDIVWIDPYPVPFKPVTFVSDSVAGAVASVPKDKPVWVVPQAFDWNIWKTGKVDKVHRPTPAEERCMTYLALVHGAKGVIYWAHTASKYYIRDYPEHWEAMKRLAGELRDLSDPLLADTDPRKLKVSDGPTVDTMVKVQGGHTWVFAVNREPEACSASFELAGLTTSKADVLFEDRTVGAKAGVWTDSFEPLEVHVYRF